MPINNNNPNVYYNINPLTPFGHLEAVSSDDRNTWVDLNGRDDNGTVTITYRYADPNYPDISDFKDTAEFSDQQRLRIDEVFDAFEEYINIDYQLVDSNENADITVYKTEDLPFAGVSNGVTGTGFIKLNARDIDITVDDFVETPGEPGGSLRQVMGHELEHSMGLHHAHTTEGFNLDLDYDSTIMAWNDWYNDTTYYGPQGLDMHALQRIYGPSLHLKGDNQYIIDGSRKAYTIGEVHAGYYPEFGDGGTDSLIVTVDSDSIVDLRSGVHNRTSAGLSTVWVTGDIENAQTAAGNDTIEGNDLDNFLISSAGNDHIIARHGADTVKAGVGHDTIDAGTGNDIIDAGNGDDVIIAGTGNDIVSFGQGNDTATGGKGNNIYYIDNTDKGVKTITDFSENDKIVFENTASATQDSNTQDGQSLFNNIIYQDGNAIISTGNGTVVILEGVTAGDISASNLDTVANGNDFSTFMDPQTPTSTTPGTTTVTNDSYSSSQTPSLTAIGIASGIASAGLISTGVAVYKHVQQYSIMKEQMANRMRLSYEKVIDHYLKEHPEKKRYNLLTSDYEHIAHSKGVKKYIMEHSGVDEVQKSFVSSTVNTWRISGALTAVGILTFVTLFTIGTGGLGLALMIAGGLGAALLVGGISGVIGGKVAEKQTVDYACKQLHNPSIQRGISAQHVLQSQRDREQFRRQHLEIKQEKTKTTESNTIELSSDIQEKEKDTPATLIAYSAEGKQASVTRNRGIE